MLSGRTRERIYPWIIGLVAGVISWFFVPQAIYVRAAENLVDPMIMVGAMAIGFLMTVATMLISLERRTVIQELRGIGAYDILLGYIKSSIYAWIAVAISSIFVAVIDPVAIIPLIGCSWLRAALPIWTTLATFGFFTSHRVVRVMFALLRHSQPRRAAPPNPDRKDQPALVASN
jgi:hypothetical protein